MKRVLHCAVLVTGLLVAATACAEATQTQERSVTVDGVARTYLIHIPADVSDPAPLVLVFHGAGGTAAGIMQTTRFNELADKNRFVAVYPEGLGGNGHGGSWNVEGPPIASPVDDTGFIRALLAALKSEMHIDQSRIYATGESMGGAFAYRLACEMPDTFAAIAPIAGTMIGKCVPQNSVAIFQVHGTKDTIIPLEGGIGALVPGYAWPPVEDGIKLWAQANGCTVPEEKPDGADTACRIYKDCMQTVELCLVRNGGHAWPGSEPYGWQQRDNIYVSQSFPASERIWAFFAGHPKVSSSPLEGEDRKP